MVLNIKNDLDFIAKLLKLNKDVVENIKELNNLKYENLTSYPLKYEIYVNSELEGTELSSELEDLLEIKITEHNNIKGKETLETDNEYLNEYGIDVTCENLMNELCNTNNTKWVEIAKYFNHEDFDSIYLQISEEQYNLVKSFKSKN